MFFKHILLIIFLYEPELIFCKQIIHLFLSNTNNSINY